MWMAPRWYCHRDRHSEEGLPQELVLRLGLHKKLTPNRYAFNKWVFSPKKTVKKATKVKKGFIEKLAPIFILLLVVGIVIFRLPAVEGVNHSKKFRIRRIANWLPLGLTYAFLYMARYNLKVSQHGFGDMKDSIGAKLVASALELSNHFVELPSDYLVQYWQEKAKKINSCCFYIFTW